MTQQLRFKLRKTRLKMMRQKGGISQKKTAQPTSKRKRALSHGGNLPPPAPSRGLPPEMPKFPPPNDKQRKKTRDDPTQSQSVQAALDFFEPQELGKNICLMHALNNGLGGKHFEPTDLENASLGAGKSRTQDFSIEDLRVLGGINNSGSGATIRLSALGQKGFHLRLGRVFSRLSKGPPYSHFGTPELPTHDFSRTTPRLFLGLLSQQINT